jgi:hypothetical protein
LYQLNQLCEFSLFFDLVRFASIQPALSPPFLLPGVTSPPVDLVMLHHASFPWSQDQLTNYTSSFGNASSRRLPSWVKIEALNLHHHRQPPSPNRPTLTLHCYKKVISTLITLSITQSRLHFTSTLAKAPPVIVVLFHHRHMSIVPPHNDTHDDELAETLSLTK